MALVLMLERKTLNIVNDVAGLWQFEGGEALESDQRVGDYASTKRVIIGGTDAQNTAMLTLEGRCHVATAPICGHDRGPRR